MFKLNFILLYRTSPNVLLSMARHYLAFIFLTVTCIISFFILSTHLFDLHTRVLQLFWTDTNWTEKEIVSRPFVFLTQTEQCLPPKLSDHLKLSTNITCRCDVIVLSYKIKCQKERPPHVTYLFDNTTTWGSGRNKLFFLAMNRRPGYTYFIFTDDDVSLKFNSAATPDMKHFSPIRIFQDWLLDYEPAVGVVDFEEQKEGQKVRNKIKTNCGITNSTSVANPTIFFDPLFNAFHARTARHIFPLDTTHERVSWWLTDKYVCSAVELKFRGQALLFFPVTVENLLHRSYPRSLRGTRKAWQEFIQIIQQGAPAKYVNQSLFHEFRKDPFGYLETSKTYCRNETRHQPIVPFAHFDEQSQKEVS